MRYLLITLLLRSQSGLAQSTLDITVDPVRFQIDATNQLILCQADLAPYVALGDSTQVRLLVGNALYPITEKQVGLSYQSSYAVQQADGAYQLFFTQLPVISIHSQETIVDPKKVDAQFTYVGNDQVLTSPIGIETRGGFSQTLPKKTFDIELRESTLTDESRDAQFGDLRADDDWILDGLYNEPLRMRSFMAHKLWLAMHQPTYQVEEPEAKAGADVMWVEVFLQDSYQGVYMLSEQVDRKLLQLKKFKEGQVRGELFKAEAWSEAVLFDGVLPFDNTSRSWDGYEMKYPDEEDATDWTDLHGLVDFVVGADASAFREGIGERFDMANAIDYFIFLNLVRAADNTGKNIYVARYEESAPYFYVPWDLDGTWGLHWDGELTNVTSDILSNGLYQRLLGLNAREFRERLNQRWDALRSDALSDEAITNLINETYATLIDNDVYEREQLVWKEYTYDSASIDYLESWTARRLAYLDNYFTDVVLSAEEGTSQKRTILFPNPTNGTLTLTATIAQPTPYQLVNVHGVVVQAGTLSADNPTIDVRRLQRGYYILRAEDIAERVLITN